MKIEQTERSETSAYKIQTPENYPEESIQHLEHGESLKSRQCILSNSTSVTKSGLFNTAVNNLSNDQKVVNN